MLGLSTGDLKAFGLRGVSPTDLELMAGQNGQLDTAAANALRSKVEPKLGALGVKPEQVPSGNIQFAQLTISALQAAKLRQQAQTQARPQNSTTNMLVALGGAKKPAAALRLPLQAVQPNVPYAALATARLPRKAMVPCGVEAGKSSMGRSNSMRFGKTGVA